MKTILCYGDSLTWCFNPSNWERYSINLFMPSKLPITTLLANNLAYSKDLVHFITV
jgi:hypothetical protein